MEKSEYGCGLPDERSKNIFSGRCVEDKKELFAQLDYGDMEVAAAAQKVCYDCACLETCRQRIDELDEHLTEAGISSTIIGGEQTNLPPTSELEPLNDDASLALASIRRAICSRRINLHGVRNDDESNKIAMDALKSLSAELTADLDQERAATLACKAIYSYNRARARQRQRKDIELTSSEIISGIVTQYAADIVEAKQIIPRNDTRIYSVALCNNPQDLAQDIGELTVSSITSPKVILDSVFNNPACYKEKVQNYEARTRYLRARLTPILREEVGGNFDFSETAQRILCRSKGVELEARAREMLSSVAEHIPSYGRLVVSGQGKYTLHTDEPRVRSYDSDLEQARINFPDVPLYIIKYLKDNCSCGLLEDSLEQFCAARNFISPFVDHVGGAEWVVNKIARVAKGNEDALERAKVWRREFMRLKDKHNDDSGITMRNMMQAALSPWPDVRLECLREHYEISRRGLTHGNKLMTKFRQAVRLLNLEDAPYSEETRDMIKGVIKSMDQEQLDGLSVRLLPTIFARYIKAFETFFPNSDLSMCESALVDAILVLAIDAQAFKNLKFTHSNRIALRYSPADLRALIARYDNDPDIDLTTIKCVLPNHKHENFGPIIGRIKAYSSWLRQEYGNKLTPSLRRELAMKYGSSTRDNNFSAVDRLESLSAAAEEVGYSWLVDADFRYFVMKNCSPEVAVEKFTNWCDAVQSAIDKFGEHRYFKVNYGRKSSPRSIKELVPQARPDLAEHEIEDFISTCNQAIREFRSACVTERFVIESVLDYRYSYRSRIDDHARNIREMRNYLGDWVEDVVVAFLAGHGKRRFDVADEWLRSYHLLKENFKGEINIEDWIAQRAATYRFMEFKRARYLAALAKNGKIGTVSYDVDFKFNNGSSLTRKDSLTSGESAAHFIDEDLEQAAEEARQKTEKVAKLVAPLSPIERAAVAIVFGVSLPESLVPDELFDENVVKRELKTSYLERYVMEVLIPKIQSTQP